MEHEDQNTRPFAAHLRKAKEDSRYDIIDENSQKEKVEVQLIKDHLNNTSELASKFAATFGAEDYAAQIGLAHDIGKYSKEFQKRIWENGPKIDHSTAGAKEEINTNDWNLFGVAAASCIAGHHSGLLNVGSFFDDSCTTKSLRARINKNTPDYMNFRRDIKLDKLPKRHSFNIVGSSKIDSGMFSAMFWTRMLFSCLVDADYLDTEIFMNYGLSKRDAGDSLKILLDKLNNYIKKKNWLNGESHINKLRSKILLDCIEKGKRFGNGAYTLTVPTGGGKTIDSLAFALNNAVAQNKNRIIYVVPYCSIIDQTVEVFSDILGTKNVLAHYSNIDISEYDENDDTMYSKKLATENWNKPVIVTTAVQFFESLFACKTSQCRKLHNIVNTVVIFDEAQTIPQQYLKPCISSIIELINNYKCSCVFCTATQPALNRFLDNIYINHALTNMRTSEICTDTDKLYEEFKRVTYKYKGQISDDKIVEELMKQDQVLCIVSTRRHAYNLYKLMEGEGNYHLSKNMIPKDIKKTLSIIRTRLKDGKICRVIATNLVEAGVDFDFKIVFRSKAGLDNIIQAGGRCNREGRYPVEESIVYIFQPEEKYLAHLPDMIKRPAEITDVVTKDVEDMAEQWVVTKYFNNLFNNLDGGNIEISDGLDIKHINARINECQKFAFPFADISKDFKLIDDVTIAVLIPIDEVSINLSEKLQNEKEYMSEEDYRKIGNYCVNIYMNNVKELINSLVMVSTNLAILTVQELYDRNTGLKLKDEGGNGIFF